VGVKVTFAVQLAPTASEEEQLVDAENGPDADTDVRVTDVLPEFES
jgi:hypothetical protein